MALILLIFIMIIYEVIQVNVFVLLWHFTYIMVLMQVLQIDKMFHGNLNIICFLYLIFGLILMHFSLILNLII